MTAVLIALISLVGWLFTDPIAQNLQYHDFADARALAGLPNAANVLSNLPFIAVGLLGLAQLSRLRDDLGAVALIYAVLFVGVVLTGFGSGYYHLAPDNHRLLWDRLPMTVCFAAFSALVIAERFSVDAGRKLLFWLLGLGIGSVLYWYRVDDLRPYLLIQFGPMLVLPFVIWRCSGPGTVWLWLTLGFYLLAKVAEMLDGYLFALTQGLVSGHALKHLLAATGALMIVLKIAQSARVDVRLSMADRWRFLLLGAFDPIVLLFAKRYSTFLMLLKVIRPSTLDALSRICAFRAYWRARRQVPAYRRFLGDRRISGWEEVPETDKDTYIRTCSVGERCTGGAIPARRIMIDESSGSTGVPGDWVRSARERSEAQRFVSYFTTFCYGPGPRLIINAFSMGAWATGLNVGAAMERNGIVKNTGPDIDKILHTLDVFGAGHRYLIAGYPPFLKRIVDEATHRGFPLERYRIDALVGGEGMSEGLRDYLLGCYGRVFSGYGATDLEIGIAGETPFTVALRRLARDNPALRRTLFGDDSRLPMVFQYNPAMHFIEVNAAGELLFTITRNSILSPRIRYNLHDQGGVCRYDELRRRLRPFGIDPDRLNRTENGRGLHLPLLWVFGRKDDTLSLMGANIYPENLEQCIYSDPSLARITVSFCQAMREDARGNPGLDFHFEITDEPSSELEQRYLAVILDCLPKINADFRKAREEYPEVLVPAIHLFHEGEGPFAADRARIKQRRLLAGQARKDDYH